MPLPTVNYEQTGVPAGDFIDFLNYSQTCQHASFNGSHIVTSGTNRPRVLENAGDGVQMHLMGIKPPLLGPSVSTTSGSFTGDIQIAVQRVDRPNQSGERRSGIGPVFPNGVAVDSLVNYTPELTDYASMVDDYPIISIGGDGNQAIGMALTANGAVTDSLLNVIGGEVQPTSVYQINKIVLYGYAPSASEEETLEIKVGLYKSTGSSNYTGLRLISDLVTLTEASIPPIGSSDCSIPISFATPVTIPDADIELVRIIVSVGSNMTEDAEVVFFFDPSASPAPSGLRALSFSTSAAWASGTGWTTTAAASASITQATANVRKASSTSESSLLAGTLAKNAFVPTVGTERLIIAGKLIGLNTGTATGFGNSLAALTDLSSGTTFTPEGEGCLAFYDPANPTHEYFISQVGTSCRVNRFVSGVYDATFGTGGTATFTIPADTSILDVDPTGTYLLVQGASNRDYRVFASSSGFTVWTQTAFTPSGSNLIRARQIRSSPDDSTIVLLSGEGGINRSTNSGVSFSSALAVTTDAVGTPETAAAFLDSYPMYMDFITGGIVVFVYRNGTNQLFIRRSTNSGSTWGSAVSIAGAVSPGSSVSISPDDPTVIYVCNGAPVGAAKVFRSSDSGATWSAIGSAPQGSIVLASPSDSTIFYLASSIRTRSTSQVFTPPYANPTQIAVVGGSGITYVPQITGTVDVSRNTASANVAPALLYSVERTTYLDQGANEALTVRRFTNNTVVVDTADMYNNEPEAVVQGGTEQFTHFAILFRDFTLGSEWREVGIIPAGDVFQYDASRASLAGYPTIFPEFFEVPGGFEDVENLRSEAGERLALVGQQGYDFFEGIPGAGTELSRIETPVVTQGTTPFLLGAEVATINSEDSGIITVTPLGNPGDFFALVPEGTICNWLTTSGIGGVLAILSVSDNGDGSFDLGYAQPEGRTPAQRLYLGLGEPVQAATVFNAVLTSGVEAAQYPNFFKVTLVSPDARLMAQIDTGTIVMFRSPNFAAVGYAEVTRDANKSPGFLYYKTVRGSAPSFGYSLHIGRSIVDSNPIGCCVSFFERSGGIAARAYLRPDSDTNRLGLYQVVRNAVQVINGTEVPPEYGVRGVNANGSAYAEIRSILFGSAQTGSTRVRVSQAVADDFWQQRDISFDGGQTTGTVKKVVTYNLEPLAITGASGGAEIEITTDKPHGLTTGSKVTQYGVGGNTAANVQGVTITVTGPNTYTLDGTPANGSYTSGGTVVRWLDFPELELYSPWQGASVSRSPIFVRSDYTSVYFAGSEYNTKEAISGLTRFNLFPESRLRLVRATRGSLYVISEKNEYFVLDVRPFLIPRTEGEFNSIFVAITNQVAASKETAAFSCSSPNCEIDGQGVLYWASPQGIYRLSRPNVELVPFMRDRFAKFTNNSYKRMAMALDPGLFPLPTLRVGALAYEDNETIQQLGYCPDSNKWLNFGGTYKVDAMCQSVSRSGASRVLFGGNGRIGVYGTANVERDFSGFLDDTKGQNVLSLGRSRGTQYDGFFLGSQVTETGGDETSGYLYNILMPWRYAEPLTLEATETQAISEFTDGSPSSITTLEPNNMPRLGRVQVGDVVSPEGANAVWDTTRTTETQFQLDASDLSGVYDGDGVFARDLPSTINQWGLTYNTPVDSSDIPHLPAAPDLKVVIWNNSTGEFIETQMIGLETESGNTLVVYSPTQLTFDAAQLYYWALGPRPWSVVTPAARPRPGNEWVEVKSMTFQINPQWEKSKPWWIKIQIYGSWKGGPTDPDVPYLTRIVPGSRLDNDSRLKLYFQTRLFRSVSVKLSGFSPVDGQAAITFLEVEYNDGKG